MMKRLLLSLIGIICFLTINAQPLSQALLPIESNTDQRLVTMVDATPDNNCFFYCKPANDIISILSSGPIGWKYKKFIQYLYERIDSNKGEFIIISSLHTYFGIINTLKAIGKVACCLYSKARIKTYG